MMMVMMMMVVVMMVPVRPRMGGGGERGQSHGDAQCQGRDQLLGHDCNLLCEGASDRTRIDNAAVKMNKAPTPRRRRPT
jgi:hypothetical protein